MNLHHIIQKVVKRYIQENVKEKETLNEYLDKEYMMPLYNYLRNGEKYSTGGHYSPSKKLILPFFDWATNDLDDTEWKGFCQALKNCQKLKGLIQGGKYHDKNVINCYTKKSTGLKLTPTKEFLKANAAMIFNITYYDNELSLFWDKFMTQCINTMQGARHIFHNKENMDADTILMNPSLKKPQWLVHLTQEEDIAFDILKNGFKYGTEVKDMDRLAYSNAFTKKEEKKGKYLYAYNAVDIAKGYFPTNFYVKDKNYHKFSEPFDQKTWEYATQFAILFTAPGIESYHSTDTQYQVIFNADTAHNFVLISRHPENGWEVNTTQGKVVYRNSSLTRAIKWVMDNFSQYRNKICWK